VEQLRAAASEPEAEDLPTVRCCACLDTVPEVKAVVCAGQEEHAICREPCFSEYVASLAELGGDFYSAKNEEWGAKKAGDVMCSLFASKCASRPFSHAEVVGALDGQTIVQTTYLAAHNQVVGEEAVRMHDEERARVATVEEERVALMTVLER
jgi:hypothetical protein